jgi:hypothetical protein
MAGNIILIMNAYFPVLRYVPEFRIHLVGNMTFNACTLLKLSPGPGFGKKLFFEILFIP